MALRKETLPALHGGERKSRRGLIGCGRGEFLHRGSLGTLGPRDDLELDTLTFVQGAETRALDRRVMDEHVAAFVSRDKAIPFFRVKPFDRTLCQGMILLT
jgi:hypothetical protein